MATYDVVVIGGGLVGASFACLLGADPLTKHLRVALVDGSDLKNLLSHKSGSQSEDEVPDPRVIAVNPRSAQMLSKIGVWQLVSQDTLRCAPFRDMQVWDFSDAGSIRFQAQELGLEDLGHIVENDLILRVTYRVLKERTAVDILAPASVKSIHLPGSDMGATAESASVPDEQSPAPACTESRQLAQVSMSDGSCMNARLVVGADGGNSKVRSMAGLRVLSYPYRQQAAVATVQVDAANTIAWQRFLPTGPLALLPMGTSSSGTHFSNVVWSTTPQQAAELKQMPPGAFLRTLNDSFTKTYPGNVQSPYDPLHALLPFGQFARRGQEGGTSGLISSFLPQRLTPGHIAGEVPRSPEAVALSSPVKTFPLTLRYSGRYTRPGLAIIGDAAHTVHPLAGQGANLGFADAEALADTISNAVRTGGNFADVTALRGYERRRWPANTLMLSGLHAIQQSFALSSPLLSKSRGMALSVLSRSGALKKLLMQAALGS